MFTPARIIWGRLSFLFVLFFILPALSLPAEEEPLPSGDSLVNTSLGDARTLIPFLADDSASSDICSLIFNGLTKYDRNLNLVGDLAQDWEVSPDKLTITFHLRPGVYWQDGKPFTAEDVKFTFEAILDPRNACPYIGSYQDIEEISVLDPLTVTFRYRQPYAPALHKLGMGLIPRHLLQGVDIRESNFKREPTGNGRFLFGEWRTDEFVILNVNPDYFEGRPYLKRYVVRVIPDQAVQYLELITEGIDIMGLTPYQYKFRTETKDFKEKCRKYKYRGGGYAFIGYNLLDPLFQDVRVRRALGMVVNKKQIIEGILLGLAEPVTGPFWKRTWAYNEKVPDLPYDPDQAKELLQECGWKDTDGDGILDKDGQPFTFKLITNQGNKQREDIAIIVQRQWSEIGIEVDVQIIAWPTFLSEFIDKKKFQAVILGWTATVDPDCYNVWHSESSRPGGLNFISYKNPEVDDLIIRGRQIFEQKERQKVYHRIHEILARDQPYTFLYTPFSLVAVNRRIRGIEPAPSGIIWNLIKWWVPAAEQKYLY